MQDGKQIGQKGHIKKCLRTYFSRACNSRDLSVKVCRICVVFHHKIAGMMKQRLPVYCILYLSYLLQITELKALSLRER